MFELGLIKERRVDISCNDYTCRQIDQIFKNLQPLAFSLGAGRSSSLARLSMNDFARQSSCTCIAAYIVLTCQQYENVYEHQANDCRRSAWQRQTGPSWRSSWRVQLNVPMFQPSVVVYGGHATARTSTSLAEFGHRLGRDDFDDILCGAALVASPFVAFSGNR